MESAGIIDEHRPARRDWPFKGAEMKKQPTGSPDADPLFASIIAAFAADRTVTVGKMFGSVGLKVHGKVFAMVVKGKLVVKLPKERVEALVASAKGEFFDPGHGRLMKEWVAVATGDKRSWLGLAKEAKRYVGGA